jgi:hypothetical protein
MTTEKIFNIDGLQPNSNHSIRVRALYRDGSYSNWSKLFKLKVKGDTDPPSQPSAPTIFVPDLSTQSSRNASAMGPQTVRFRHDATKNGGGNLEADIDYFEVYVSTTDSNSGGTQIGTVKATRPGLGAYSEGTLSVNAPGETASRWFYVIAVDMSGQRSSASPTTQASAIPMFANAYISDLSADKITTGTLQANQQISVGTLVPIVIKSNDSSPRGQIYVGTRVNPTGEIGSGYRDIQTAFYVDSTGKLSLKDKFYWDSTSLTIKGTVTSTGLIVEGGAATVKVLPGWPESAPLTYSLLSTDGKDIVLEAVSGGDPAKIRWVDQTDYQRATVGWEPTSSNFPQYFVVRSLGALGGNDGKILIDAGAQGNIILRSKDVNIDTNNGGSFTIDGETVETPATIRNRYKNGINSPSDGNKITFSASGPTGTPNRGDIHLRYL